MTSMLVTELTAQTQLRQKVEEDITGLCKENKGMISKGVLSLNNGEVSALLSH